jgi:hypothetical protein
VSDRRSRAALAAVLALVAGAAVAVAASGRGEERRREGREFQRLVRGLGFGPATDLERRGAEFDPRVASPVPPGLADGPAEAPRSPLSPPGG